MKKIIYIISLFVSSVLYTSCDAFSDGSLQKIISEVVITGKNEAQVEGFMYGMHSQLRRSDNPSDSPAVTAWWYTTRW